MGKMLVGVVRRLFVVVWLRRLAVLLSVLFPTFGPEAWSGSSVDAVFVVAGPIDWRICACARFMMCFVLFKIVLVERSSSHKRLGCVS